MMECPKCRGCGKVATSDQQEPWSDWLALPLGSALAVTMGFVKPMPCPQCGGAGKIGVHCVTCRCESAATSQGEA